MKRARQPRPLWLALFVVLVVSVAIYWPQLHLHLAASHFCKR